MRGRKPKPIETKRREGNPGKRKLPEALALPDAGALVRPPELPPDAAALWDELVPILHRAGVVHQVDRPTLVALCLQWQRGRDAGRVVEQQGLFARGSTGQTTTHPAVAIERNAHELVLRFAEQYGLTAAARARIASDVAGAMAAANAERDEVLEGEAEEVDVDVDEL